MFQFKIWEQESSSMFVLVKEGSDLLKCLNVGDVYNMKFYRSGETIRTEKLDARIKYITQEENGRFGGHCLVGLEIAEEELH